jgi:excinuclease ABC subunit C
MTLGALEKLQGHLHLASMPQRIECYDISNIQGREPVGSMVVFLGGLPSKKDYRRFQIRFTKGPDDYAMMHEVLTRRFSKPMGAKNGEQDSSFAAIPDLIVVDGGKGQVSAAKKALEEKGYVQLPLIGLAKEREEIFLPGNPNPLILPHADQGLRLLQRIRDEAHRFAVTYHRNLRTRRMVQSALDQIPGIGKQRKINLLKEFGSLEGIRQADPDEIQRVTGMNRKQVSVLKEHLELREVEEDQHELRDDVEIDK